jgi:hypothetical protein
MEPEGSLPYSQVPATRLYPEPNLYYIIVTWNNVHENIKENKNKLCKNFVFCNL